MKRERRITIYGEYFQDFYLKLSSVVQAKVDYVFRIIESAERMPEKFFKHLEGTDGLFEIRVESGGNIYRIFCCFDRGNLIVLFNALHKKSQKTPRREIELAEKLKSEYFESKRLGK